MTNTPDANGQEPPRYGERDASAQLPQVPAAPDSVPAYPAGQAPTYPGGAPAGQVSQDDLPPENVQRGVILSLVAVPAGVVAWTLLWEVGVIASIVGYGVAFLAFVLYRVGSGGRVTRPGAIAITVVTIGTLLLSFFVGLVVDFLGQFTKVAQLSWIDALGQPRFWDLFGGFVSDNMGHVAVSFLLALVFGALGCFSTLRRVFRQAR